MVDCAFESIFPSTRDVLEDVKCSAPWPRQPLLPGSSSFGLFSLGVDCAHVRLPIEDDLSGGVGLFFGLKTVSFLVLAKACCAFAQVAGFFEAPPSCEPVPFLCFLSLEVS